MNIQNTLIVLGVMVCIKLIIIPIEILLKFLLKGAESPILWFLSKVVTAIYAILICLSAPVGFIVMYFENRASKHTREEMIEKQKEYDQVNQRIDERQRYEIESLKGSNQILQAEISKLTAKIGDLRKSSREEGYNKGYSDGYRDTQKYYEHLLASYHPKAEKSTAQLKDNPKEVLYTVETPTGMIVTAPESKLTDVLEEKASKPTRFQRELFKDMMRQEIYGSRNRSDK